MHGDPTYMELGVRDADAARAFYGTFVQMDGIRGNRARPSEHVGRRFDRRSKLMMVAVSAVSGARVGGHVRCRAVCS